MRRAPLIVFLSIICLYSASIAQPVSPSDYLPHHYGSAFTPHHLLVDYFYEIAKESPLVEIESYGSTNQNRPLILAVITSKKNHQKIDAIRLNNLIRAGAQTGVLDDDLDKSIVWLTFGVHGNEAGSSESALAVLHALADEDGEAKAWLEDVVVLLDPCANPDGYNRYTNWYVNQSSKRPNIDRMDIEHREPWPTGRVNHYLHDLNRDWAWLTQKESQQRIRLYHQWMPHIHADFHEMFPESPHYFPPAAEPFHTTITDWQRELQLAIGKNHARYFDANRWLFYTGEHFDLFYPAYGDTYPTFNGAVGMTYEQAGHGISGRAIGLTNGDTLTLQDRIDRQTVTALSTVEIAAFKKESIIREFESYFTNAASNNSGKYKSYIIKNSNNLDRIDFLHLLDKHRIKYYQTTSSGDVEGFCFPEFENKSFAYEGGDIVIPTKQHQGTLVQVLLEPKSELVDSITYDITAWSLLAAYGLQSVATDVDVSYETFTNKVSEPISFSSAYAYAIPYQGWATAKLIAELNKASVRLRMTNRPFTNSGFNCPRGTIVATAFDNSSIPLDATIQKFTKNYNGQIYSLMTGFSEQGPDLGSEDLALMQSPKILIVGGAGVSQYNYGQIWHLLDIDLELPHTKIDESQLGNIDFIKFNTIVLPRGYYPNMDDGVKQKLMDWVADGGKLIAFETAISAIAGENGFSIDLQKESTKSVSNGESHDHKLEQYAVAQRSGISDRMPGAIVRLQIDDSHPLGFGMGRHYASLKQSSLIIPLQDRTWNVGYVADELHYSGFIGQRVKDRLKNSNSFFVKDYGQGHVIGLADNPLYRSFWYKGKQLVFNAFFSVQ